MTFRRTAQSYYLNQHWPSLVTHKWGTRRRWIKLVPANEIRAYLCKVSVTNWIFSTLFLIRWQHNPWSCITLHWGRWRLKSPASRLFSEPFVQAQKKQTSKLRVTRLCGGNSSVTGEFPTQRASNAENFSIWWLHHEHYYLSLTSANHLSWFEFRICPNNDIHKPATQSCLDRYLLP